jgi:hypothetical protein
VLVAHFSSGEPHSALLVQRWYMPHDLPPDMQMPEPSAVTAQTQPLLALSPQGFQAPQREPAQLGTSGMAGATHLPALQESPETQVLSQEPQFCVSVCRSRQVSGAVPQREDVKPEQGHEVAVMKAVSVMVDVGERVRVVAGTVR